VDDLFEHPQQSRTIRVGLPQVKTSLDYYKVRMWLLDSDWVEFEDWYIAKESFQTGIFEVWFTKLDKAMYFKLTFTL